MFRWLHTYYLNVLDKPSILFPINLWTFVNIRYFKFKFLKSIYIFIANADSLRIKYINVLYKDMLIETIFSKTVNYIIILIILFFLI